MFGSVVAVVFQITFCAKMHVNDFFYFFKIIFDISTSKRSKTYKPLKKKIEFYRIFYNFLINNSSWHLNMYKICSEHVHGNVRDFEPMFILWQPPFLFLFLFLFFFLFLFLFLFFLGQQLIKKKFILCDHLKTISTHRF